MMERSFEKFDVFIKKAIISSPSIYNLLDDSYRDDEALALAVLEKNSVDAYFYFSERIQRAEKILEYIAEKNGKMFVAVFKQLEIIREGNLSKKIKRSDIYAGENLPIHSYNSWAIIAVNITMVILIITVLILYFFHRH